MNAIATASTDRKVHVPLGERAYDILIGPGLIARAGAEIASRLKGRKAAIITDEHVAPLYLDALMVEP
jgi:3-dehydroquinate synthase